MKKKQTVEIVIFSMIIATVFQLYLLCPEVSFGTLSRKPLNNELLILNNSTICKIDVGIIEIDAKSESARVKFSMTLRNLPYIGHEVEVNLNGGGSSKIICENTQNSSSLSQYDGEANETTWLLDGYGEAFPFEVYSLKFSLDQSFLHDKGNISFLAGKIAFQGQKSSELVDNWQIPKIGTLRESAPSIDLVLERSPRSKLLMYFEVSLPTAICFYLLGVSLALEPKHIAEKLVISIALLAFVFPFLSFIQPFLPYRSSACFPELLLINLFIVNLTWLLFGVISFVLSKKNAEREKNIFSSVVLLSILALYFLSILLYYYFAGYGKIGLANFIVALCIAPTYVYGLLFSIYLGAESKPKAIAAITLMVLPFIVMILVIPVIIFGSIL